ncbi:MAG: EamA family transporter [Pseudomonadota bacterium]|nr:EamA family transporter [Pseudomonadota bacterium]
MWLRTPIRPTVLLGGVVGLSGVMLLFSNELDALSLQDSAALGLGLALLSTLLASLGNIAAAHNTASGTSIMVINAWAMAYGTLALVATALLLGIPFTMNFSFSYLTAMLYLTIPGSIITFAGYLRLIHLLGADKAAYMSMLVPVIALLISSLFEGYQWTLLAVLGLALILCGNWLALRRRSG